MQEQLSDVLAIAGDLSLPLKLGWGICLTWVAVQIGWYRRARIVPPPPSWGAPRRAR